MKRTRHHQEGYVFKKGSNWYVRYREDVLAEHGIIKRIQKCRRLAEGNLAERGGFEPPVGVLAPTTV